MNPRNILYLVFAAILFSGCDVNATPEIVSSATPNFVTATLAPTNPPQPTSTPLPPTMIPTVTPVEGRATTEVNVRADTSTVSESFGVIAPFSTVQVIGQDASGKWFQVMFEAAPTGAGWVRADFVQVDASAEIPVRAAGAGLGAVRGVVLRGVNVRKGPGQDFESLGLLNENDVLDILGRDASGAWIQIDYPGSPGWVAADFLQVDDLAALPVIGDATQTPVTLPVEETPASSALWDGDSAEMPFATFGLGPGAAQAVQLEGEVSASGGDAEDWAAFSSSVSEVSIELGCDQAGLQVTLWQGGAALETFTPACGGGFKVEVAPQEAYLLRISSTSEEAQGRYRLKVWVLH